MKRLQGLVCQPINLHLISSNNFIILVRCVALWNRPFIAVLAKDHLVLDKSRSYSDSMESFWETNEEKSPRVLNGEWL